MGNKIPLIFPAVLAGGAPPWYLSGGGIPAANCIAAYKAIGAASLAASYVNLANPGTYDATAPVAAPTFAEATGWTFDGSSQYLSSGITPADGRTWTVIARFSGIAGAGNYMLGYLPLSSIGFIINPYTAGNLRRYMNGGAANGAAYSTSGIIAIAGDTAYINGVSDATLVLAANTGTIYIGAVHRDGAGPPPVVYYRAVAIQAMAIYNAVLSPAQIIAVNNAMAALPPP